MNRQTMAVITAGFFTLFIAYAIRYGYGMLLPKMLPALGISKTGAGVIYASYFLCYTLSSPVLGNLSDRYDIRLMLTVFSALLAAGTCLMSFAASVWTASFFFALAGVGSAACWAPVVALVQKWVTDARRGTALAVTTLGSAFGIAVWGLLLPIIVTAHGWRAGWMGMGLFGFFVAGLNFAWIRNPPPKTDPVHPVSAEQAGRPSDGMSVRMLLGNPGLWWIGLSYLMVGFTVLVPQTFLSAYATEELRASYGVSTGFITVIAVSGMIGKVILGIWSDTVGRVKVMMACGVFLGAGCLGMACFKSIGAVYGFAALFGIGFGAVWPVYAAAAPDFFPRQSSGSVIGVWTLFFGVGSIVSPIVCGWSIDRTGSYTGTFMMGLAGGLTASLLAAPMVNRRPSVSRTVVG